MRGRPGNVWQVLTHVARAAATQLNKTLCGRALLALRALVSVQCRSGQSNPNLIAHACLMLQPIHKFNEIRVRVSGPNNIRQ